MPVKKNCIIFFVKDPEKSRVKTRLSRNLGKKITAGLYRCFILDTLSALKKTGAKINICVHPENSENSIRKWLGRDYGYSVQKGKDLGGRMRRAFAEGFGNGGYEKIIVLGSDSPDLPAETVCEAFRALNNSPAVIGPSADGGYYLLGFNGSSFLPEVFKGIKWSRASVFEKTVEIMRKAGYKPDILRKWSDVDTDEDLKYLIRRNQNTRFKRSKTMTFIGREKLYDKI